MVQVCLQLTTGRTLVLAVGRSLVAGDLVDATGPVLGDVAGHPTQPGVFGLRNQTGRPWSASVVGGPQQPVPPGRSVTLADGTVVDFGGVQAAIGGDTSTGWALAAGRHRIPLVPGTSILSAHLLGVAGPSATVAEVVANPLDPDVIGLRNMTGAAWDAVLPDGRPAVIDPGKSVRLAPGTRVRLHAANVRVELAPAMASVPATRPTVTAPGTPPWFEPGLVPASSAGPSAAATATDRDPGRDLRRLVLPAMVVLIYALLARSVTAVAVTAGLAAVLRSSGDRIDRILQPVWSQRDRIPRRVRTVLAWVLPVVLAFYVTGSATLSGRLDGLPLVGPDASVFAVVTAIGGLLSYVLIREPASVPRP